MQTLFNLALNAHLKNTNNSPNIFSLNNNGSLHFENLFDKFNLFFDPKRKDFKFITQNKSPLFLVYSWYTTDYANANNLPYMRKNCIFKGTIVDLKNSQTRNQQISIHVETSEEFANSSPGSRIIETTSVDELTSVHEIHHFPFLGYKSTEFTKFVCSHQKIPIPGIKQIYFEIETTGKIQIKNVCNDLKIGFNLPECIFFKNPVQQIKSFSIKGRFIQHALHEQLSGGFDSFCNRCTTPQQSFYPIERKFEIIIKYEIKVTTDGFVRIDSINHPTESAWFEFKLPNECLNVSPDEYQKFQLERLQLREKQAKFLDQLFALKKRNISIMGDNEEPINSKKQKN